jgi:hypothetical protein
VQLTAVFAVLPFFHELDTTLAFPLKKEELFSCCSWPRECDAEVKDSPNLLYSSMGMVLSGLFTKLSKHILQVAGHSILAAILWNCARSVDLTRKAAITSFYMFIWKVTPVHPAPPMSYAYFIISVITLGAADCTALFNHITFCTPVILDGAINRVDGY